MHARVGVANGARSAMCVGVLSLLAGCSQAPPEPPLPQLSTLPPRPHVMFVSAAGDDTFHRVKIASTDAPERGAFVTGLSCDRVYFGGQAGICLTSNTDAAEPTWWAEVFNEKFEGVRRVKLTGAPSRVRVSPDGRLAAATVFESGHSYAQHGFSTVTTIIDTADGTVLGDLEQFQVRRDGQVIREVDFNFWGVTFARDGDTFFATLDTAGVSSLVKGSVTKKTMEVVRDGVECPSLSPDNSQIAYKKRVGARSHGWWQIAVLRLDTMVETIVAIETRSVDDQVEWLDDQSVLYHLGAEADANIWAVRVDNSSPPRRLLPAAYSPAVVR